MVPCRHVGVRESDAGPTDLLKLTFVGCRRRALTRALGDREPETLAFGDPAMGERDGDARTELIGEPDELAELESDIEVEGCGSSCLGAGQTVRSAQRQPRASRGARACLAARFSPLAARGRTANDSEPELRASQETWGCGCIFAETTSAALASGLLARDSLPLHSPPLAYLPLAAAHHEHTDEHPRTRQTNRS
eukprot:2117731-Rhodomonas_salina.1